MMPGLSLDGGGFIAGFSGQTNRTEVFTNIDGSGSFNRFRPQSSTQTQSTDVYDGIDSTHSHVRVTGVRFLF